MPSEFAERNIKTRFNDVFSGATKSLENALNAKNKGGSRDELHNAESDAKYLSSLIEKISNAELKTELSRKHQQLSDAIASAKTRLGVLPKLEVRDLTGTPTRVTFGDWLRTRFQPKIKFKEKPTYFVGKIPLSYRANINGQEAFVGKTLADKPVFIGKEKNPGIFKYVLRNGLSPIEFSEKEMQKVETPLSKFAAKTKSLFKRKR